MKFFHLSDLHIGKKLFGRDLLDDQNYILRQITEYAGKEQPDAVLIAGDVYDRAVPSAEAVELFDHFLTELIAAAPHAAVMIISGNHDSGPRIDCFRHILCRQNVYLIGMPPVSAGEHIAQVTLEDDWGPVHFWLLPFVRPSMVHEIVLAEDKLTENPKTAVDETVQEGAREGTVTYDSALHLLLGREKVCTDERNVLVSHQFYVPQGVDAGNISRTESEILTVGNIDAVSADVLEPFDYAALGHIHRPMRVGGEQYRYCGTPLAYSLSEAGQRKEILMTELREKGNVRVTAIPLHPLREVRILRGSLKDVLKERCTDYVSVLLTDREDLDVLDMQDRLREAFPGLLEIRRDSGNTPYYSSLPEQEKSMDPYELLCSFLNDADDEKRRILRDVLNAVKNREGGAS